MNTGKLEWSALGGVSYLNFPFLYVSENFLSGLEKLYGINVLSFVNSFHDTSFKIR